MNGSSRVAELPAGNTARLATAIREVTTSAAARPMPTRPLFRLLPMIGAACELRQGELFGLALEDVDFEERVLRIRRQIKKLGSDHAYALPKNDRERVIPLPGWAGRGRQAARLGLSPADLLAALGEAGRQATHAQSAVPRRVRASRRSRCRSGT